MKLIKKPTSLKGTLLLLLIPSGIIMMTIAWIIHGHLLDKMSREFVESRLQEEVYFLEHNIREAGGDLDILETGDYFEKVFHHAFALESPTQTVISPTIWQPVLKSLLNSEVQGFIWSSDSEANSSQAEILAYRKSLVVNGMPITIVVAENLRELQSSQANLHTWTAVVSIMLIILLAAVTWIGISISLRPVASMKMSLKNLQSGNISRMRVIAPDEFEPLVTQLNQLLDSLDQRLTRSREALANLSHSVKTPVATLRQLLKDTSHPLSNELRLEMAARLSDLNNQLEAEIRRSRLAGPRIGKNAMPVRQSRELLWMFGRLYSDKHFDLSSDLPEDIRWPIEEQDLNEILGNTLDNAGKWAVQFVDLILEQHNDVACITICDDGKGVATEDLEYLGLRGRRFDEQIPGHGLGLSIVTDIVSRYHGDIEFSHHHLGGLKVVIAIPFSKKE